MKKSSFRSYLLPLIFLFVFTSDAYEILEEKITITPGCEGGVMYSITESGYISSAPKDLFLNFDNIVEIHNEN